MPNTSNRISRRGALAGVGTAVVTAGLGAAAVETGLLTGRSWAYRWPRRPRRPRRSGAMGHGRLDDQWVLPVGATTRPQGRPPFWAATRDYVDGFPSPPAGGFERGDHDLGYWRRMAGPHLAFLGSALGRPTT